MKVLSLFDGMSCGHQALERAEIDVDTYYASEIDKYAIQVTMANYPDTIQLGSVVDINALELPKIDLLIGGSPCQSFSFAGKRKGMSTKDEQEILTLDHYLKLKSEGYEFEGQSYLFWEYMRILEELRVKNPNVLFLLENVEMGAKWEKVLSNAIGVRGIHINSALVSAQNRKRIYWINWGMKPMGLFGDMESIIEQPKDRKILLKDILQDNPNAKYFISNKMKEHLNSRDSVKIKNGEDKSGAITTNGEGKQGNNSTFVCESVDEKYFLSERVIDRIMSYNNSDRSIDDSDKSLCLAAGYFKQGRDNQLIVHNTMPRSSTTGKGGTGPLSRNDGKTYCLDTGNTNAVEIVGLTEVRTEQAKQIRRETGTNPKREKELVERTDGKIGALLTSQTPDNLVKVVGMDFRYDEGFRERRGGESPTLCLGSDNGLSGNALVKLNSRIRRLTPIECERLQTVADNYTANGLENHFHFINFTGNENNEICQQSVKNKDVHNQFQVEKLNYATSIIIDYLEKEQPNCQDQLSTILKNAKWMVVKDINNLQSKRVLCTIKGGKDMEFLKFPKELINRKLNVNFAIRKSEEAELSDCVQSIIKCGNFTETHYLQKKKDLMLVQEDIIETPMELNFIDELLKSNLEENLLKESKLYTISILINSIITQAIYKFLPKKNTLLHINSSIKLQEDSLELELSYIKTESIVSMSDSVRYKALGNGWTIEVISYLFKHI
jgi:DNA-cytosine methyltransferase